MTMSTSFYVERSSPIHRLNPVTKLVAMIVTVVVVFAVPSWWAAAIVLLAVILPAAVVAGVGRRTVAVAAAILLPLLITLVAIQGLFFPEGTRVLAEFGPARVTVEGLQLALVIGLRLVVLVVAALVLLLTTHPGKLMDALTQRGMSPKISYVIASTLQIIPAFRARADAILLAQQARGLPLGGGLVRRSRALMPLVTPLVLGMFTDVEERSTAMEARAFGSTSKRTSLVPVSDSLAQRIARWALAAVAVAAIVVPMLWRTS